MILWLVGSSRSERPGPRFRRNAADLDFSLTDTQADHNREFHVRALPLIVEQLYVVPR